MDLQHKDITEAIIGSAFEVYNALGYGFLEKVYQRAMQVELQARGFKAAIEAEISVNYKGVEVGFYKADLWVNDWVIVELKAAKSYVSDVEPPTPQRTQSHRRESRAAHQLWPNQSGIQTHGLLILLYFHPCLICVPSVANNYARTRI